jgi:hypothetical protein
MNCPVKGMLIASVTAAGLTAAAWLSHAAHSGVFRLVMMVFAAPAFLASTVAFNIEWRYLVPPGAHSTAPAYFHFVSAGVFFVTAFFWIAAVFSPLLFGFRLFHLSRRGSQLLALLLAALVTLLCIYAFLAGFPRPPIKPNQSMERTATRFAFTSCVSRTSLLWATRGLSGHRSSPSR